MIYWGDLPKRLSLSETGSPAYMRTRLAQSSDSEIKVNTQVFSRHSPSVASDHSCYFSFSAMFSTNSFLSANNYQNKLFQANYSKYYQNKQNRQDDFSLLIVSTQRISFNGKPAKKIQSVFDGRGLPACSTYTYGGKFLFLLSKKYHLPISLRSYLISQLKLTLKK